MYYICTKSGLVIDSRVKKEDADNAVIGTSYFVRPSPETIRMEEDRAAYRELEAAQP